ncbi:MAG: transposase, partial [bacterium]
MKQTRPAFTQDALLGVVKQAIEEGLKSANLTDSPGTYFSNIDCLMSGLAVFTFKFPSLLKFDEARQDKDWVRQNLTQLFQIQATPCDTQMRTRLDIIPPRVLRLAYRKIFALLQRGKVLEHYLFLDKYYLISVDGTGVFSSSDVHCKNCCVKEDKQGHKTYYHQILAAALVHPDQKVVFPLAPEPILKQDGAKKNDCERNASKRWISDFRREHPHLPVVIVEDGLASNAPHIKELTQHNLRYILGCKESDHPYLTDWINALDGEDAPVIKETLHGATHEYEYFREVPLNGSKEAPHVTVIRYKETKKKTKKGTDKTTKWMWVTDLEVTPQTIREIVKGARARFHIENQTFNTLKNQGYEFEHNFGHGKQYLNHVFSLLMMLAFLIDQCLQRLNKRFQEALEKCGGKRTLWERMRHSLSTYEFIPDFE